MYDELTEQDIKKMEEEIEYRKLVVRKEALEAVKEATAQGDPSENFEYHAAKKDKNQNESRIRYLEKMIKTAKIISTDSAEDEVGMNNTVTVYFEEDDEEEVYKNALLNTYFLTPPRIYQLDRLTLEPDYEGEDFTTISCESYRVSRICKCAGYGLSTSEQTNGAVAIFFPGVAQKLSEIFEDSFYIVFVKSHAVLVYPKKRWNPEVLKKRSKDTFEEDASEEDFLTDEIYYYDRCTRKIAKWNKMASKETLIVGCVELILV